MIEYNLYRKYNEEFEITGKKYVMPAKENPNFFTPTEVRILKNAENFDFNVINNQKSISEQGKYRISIYKMGDKNFMYRVRDISKINNPIIYTSKSNIINDCLNNLEEFIMNNIRKEKEDKEKIDKFNKDRLEGEEDIFHKYSFNKIGHFENFKTK